MVELWLVAVDQRQLDTNSRRVRPGSTTFEDLEGRPERTSIAVGKANGALDLGLEQSRVLAPRPAQRNEELIAADITSHVGTHGQRLSYVFEAKGVPQSARSRKRRSDAIEVSMDDGGDLVEAREVLESGP